MYKNKALIDRTLNSPSSNDNMVLIYHKLVSLIEEYNRMARDKGLPVKIIPVYNDNMNYSLMIQSVASILKDIDRVKRIKEEDNNPPIEEKTARDVTFTTEIVTDFPDKPAWKDEGLWYYIQDGDNICVYADTEAMKAKMMNGGTTLELDYSDMPYELLVDKDGKEWEVNSYYMKRNSTNEGRYGLFGYHYQNKDWNDNVIRKLTSLTIDNWTNKYVKDMSYMFNRCEKLTSLTLGDNFSISNVTTMTGMFNGCSALTSLTLGNNFNTSSVTEMTAMFSECSMLTSLTLGDKFDTSSVTSMAIMFYNCKKLTSLTLGDKFITSSVTLMNSMFEDCSSLTELTLGDNFDTSSVMLMRAMFDGCSSLTTLTLGNKFDTSKLLNMTAIEGMFENCTRLTTIELLYKSAERIINWLPKGTWNVNGTTDITVTVNNGWTVTWNQDPPSNWATVPITLELQQST